MDLSNAMGTQKLFDFDSAFSSTGSASFVKDRPPVSEDESFDVPVGPEVSCSGCIYKLVAEKDPNNLESWVRRKVWLTYTGGLFYHSCAHNRPLARHIKGLHVCISSCTDKLYAFELHPPYSELSMAKSTVLAADTAEERDMWVWRLTSTQENLCDEYDLTPLDLFRDPSRTRSQTPEKSATCTARGRTRSRDIRAPSSSRPTSNASTAGREGAFWCDCTAGLPHVKRGRTKSWDTHAKSPSRSISNGSTTVSSRTTGNGRARSSSRSGSKESTWPADSCADSRSASKESTAPDDSCVDFNERSQTALILDWDDTVCPTTWLREDCGLKWNQPLHAQLHGDGQHDRFIRDMMSRASAVAAEFLREATSHTNVFIVTLAQKTWVDVSIQNFMPELAEILQESEVKVIYAQEHISEDLRTEYDRHEFMSSDQATNFWTDAKAEVIAQDLWGSHESKHTSRFKNIISVGDSDFERHGTIKACEEYRNSTVDRCDLRVKTLKLVSDPTVEELTAQLTLAARWLPFIVNHDGDLDLEIEDTSDDQGLSELHAFVTGEIEELSWRKLARIDA